MTGAVPFTIGVLFFLVDMTHSAFAFDHVILTSLGVAALYIWKCCWQAAFAGALFRELSPETEGQSGWMTFAIQSAMQPVGLVLFLPIPWLVAFFRNVTLF